MVGKGISGCGTPGMILGVAVTDAYTTGVKVAVMVVV